MADYLPARELDFNQWVANFVTVAGAQSAALGLSADDVADLTDQQTAWTAALLAHQTAQAAARTARQTKETSKRSLRSGVRVLVRRLQALPAMTDALRAQLGITVTNGQAVPNEGTLPQTRPIVTVDTGERLRHTLRFVDESTPTRRAKPPGVQACEVWMKVGGPPPADASELIFAGAATRARHVVSFEGGQANQSVHYMLRWVGPRGSRGPWSQTVTATVGG